jgi:hypothetical protein
MKFSLNRFKVFMQYVYTKKEVKNLLRLGKSRVSLGAPSHLDAPRLQPRSL